MMEMFTSATSATVASVTVVTNGGVTSSYTVTGGSCTSSPTLSVGGTCSVMVTFTAHTPGLTTGTVYLKDSGGNVIGTINLVSLRFR
jgi:hypothetical protein